MKRDQGLSALVVNYNSGAFCVRCVESLLAEWARDGRPRERLQVVVVDNASSEDQTQHLLRLEELGCRVVRSEVNAGYSGGVNRAWRASSGAAGDVVAILNPDLYFLPGSVARMVQYVTDHPQVGLVDPRACIDPLGVLNLPRNLLPTLFELVAIALAHLSPVFCRLYSRRRLRLSIPWLLAEEPLEADALSGCCLFARRAVLEALGQPMDEHFPLYFEDTDLCRRVRRLGLKLVHLGDARILHHWSRSVGLGPSYFGEPRRRHDVSQRYYYRKYYGALGLACIDALQWVQRRWPPRKLNRPLVPLGDLGSWERPLEVPLPRHADYLIELALDPTFIVAVGVLGSGARWVCPEDSWQWFFPNPYFVRAVDRATGESLGAWRFSKATPGRAQPLEVQELVSYGERVFGGRTG